MSLLATAPIVVEAVAVTAMPVVTVSAEAVPMGMAVTAGAVPMTTDLSHLNGNMAVTAEAGPMTTDLSHLDGKWQALAPLDFEFEDGCMSFLMKPKSFERDIKVDENGQHVAASETIHVVACGCCPMKVMSLGHRAAGDAIKWKQIPPITQVPGNLVETWSTDRSATVETKWSGPPGMESMYAPPPGIILPHGTVSVDSGRMKFEMRQNGVPRLYTVTARRVGRAQLAEIPAQLRNSLQPTLPGNRPLPLNARNDPMYAMFFAFLDDQAAFYHEHVAMRSAVGAPDVGAVQQMERA